MKITVIGALIVIAALVLLVVAADRIGSDSKK